MGACFSANASSKKNKGDGGGGQGKGLVEHRDANKNRVDENELQLAEVKSRKN